MPEMINIGCRLPSGIVLEVGLQTTVQDPMTKRPVTQVQRLDSYDRIVIKGTRAHTADQRLRQKIQVPAILNPEPAITPVDKALWNRWKEANPKSPLLRNKELFEVTGDSANARAIVLDVQARPQPLAPLDKDKKLTVGVDVVETAEFDEKGKE